MRSEFKRTACSIALFTCFLGVGASPSLAQPPAEKIVDPAAQIPKAAASELDEKVLLNDVSEKEGISAEQFALHEKFKRLLTGAKLNGQFTIDGKSMSETKSEAYEISKVEKAAEGDYWTITARIKYGDNDVEVPIMLEVKWAGSTPVITLDNLTIPGMGTFSARVLFHKDKYVGTWQHDAVGGHMFGVVELAEAAK